MPWMGAGWRSCPEADRLEAARVIALTLGLRQGEVLGLG
jgi:hypothetical protein